MNNQYPNQYPKKDYVSIIITQDNIAYFNAIQKQQRDIVALQKKLLEQKKTQELEQVSIKIQSKKVLQHSKILN